MKMSKVRYRGLTAEELAQAQGGVGFTRNKTVWFPKETNWPIFYPTK